MDNTDFAVRMKGYEKVETKDVFDVDLPLIIRLDGKGFSKFTKPFERPFDKQFRDIMSQTAVYVMDECGGSLAYTQSDEISILVDRSDIFFNAKKQKLLSVIAGMASSFFTLEAMKVWPEHVQKHIPAFDCRAFNVPNKNEAINSIYWRQKDCVRNAVSMMGHYYFSKSDMFKRSVSEVKSMLCLRKDVDWESIDTAFKYGIYSYRSSELKSIDDMTWQSIPKHSRPQNRTTMRNIVKTEAFDNATFDDIKRLVYDEGEEG